MCYYSDPSYLSPLYITVFPQTQTPFHTTHPYITEPPLHKCPHSPSSHQSLPPLHITDTHLHCSSSSHHTSLLTSVSSVFPSHHNLLHTTVFFASQTHLSNHSPPSLHRSPPLHIAVLPSHHSLLFTLVFSSSPATQITLHNPTWHSLIAALQRQSRSGRRQELHNCVCLQEHEWLLECRVVLATRGRQLRWWRGDPGKEPGSTGEHKVLGGDGQAQRENT